MSRRTKKIEQMQRELEPTEHIRDTSFRKTRNYRKKDTCKVSDRNTFVGCSCECTTVNHLMLVFDAPR